MKAWPEWVQVALIVTAGILFMAGGLASYVAIKFVGR